MLTVDIRGSRRDRFRRDAHTLSFRDAHVGPSDFPPLPDDRVTLFDGVNTAPGRVYAVHYRDKTITVAPDFSA